MQRCERRKMEQKMGLSKFKKSLSLNKQMEITRQNIIAGRKEHEEFIKSQTETAANLTAEKQQQKVYDLALRISSETNMPFIDAIEEAKKQLKK
jgi:hypothetical protein